MTEMRVPGTSSCFNNSRGKPSPPALADRTATWTLADLAVGATPVAVTATARVVAANTDIVNTATVSGGTGTGQQITNPQSNVSSGGAEAKQVPTLAQWQQFALILLLICIAAHFITRYGYRRHPYS